MEAAVNVVWAQLEKYGMDFDATVLYHGQMVIKKCCTMQSICIAKPRSQLAKPKVSAFMEMIECKKCPEAIWNSMSRGKQMQVKKLHEQQSTKSTTKQTSAEARIAGLEILLGINSQHE